MELSLVSVIVPTYQGSQVVKRAVDSVLKQSYSAIEIIVVDDNNPLSDERMMTESVMKDYADNPKVQYIKHAQNRNGSAARNTGIKAAHGSFIAFLDDDDWYLPEKIAKQLDYLIANKEFAGCYCFAKRDGEEIKTYPYKGDVTKELLLLKSRMFTPSLFFRKEALVAINGFDESYRRHQDYEMLLRFFKAGYKMGCVEDVLIEIGWGGANNAPNPKRLIELKRVFLSDFSQTIDSIDKREHGFKRKTIAIHHGSIFQTLLYYHNYWMALQIAIKYFWYSPSYFTLPVRSTLYSKILKKSVNNMY